MSRYFNDYGGFKDKCAARFLEGVKGAARFAEK